MEFLSGALSPWYHASMIIDGIKYATVEHYICSKKAEFYNDHIALAAVLAAPTPGAAKLHVYNLMDKDCEWRLLLPEILHAANREKFLQNPELKLMLLGGDLVYVSIYDRYLGAGTVEHVGENLMGKSLMQVRNELLV